jgi:photosystem II stability/assembly factor-like uncharacterized protein
MNDDDVDLGPLLRGRGEPLPAPEGTWESIVRRGQRRRRAKAGLAMAAGVVIVAGATPAILTIHHSSSNQHLQVADAQRSYRAMDPSVETPVTKPSLARLAPTSVSFVSPTEGWVSGDLRVLDGTVAGGLARTDNSGTSWSIVAGRPEPQGTVRFADAAHGFSFGTTYQSTHDGGLTWQSLPSPGYIADLETGNGVIWALVRSCVRCDGLRLFQATVTSPDLVRVSAVKPIANHDAALTLHDHAIYVTGGDTMWATTNDGYSWRHEHNPCDDGGQAFSAWTETGLAAECTPVRGVGSLFESLDAGRHWTDIANVPHVQASVGSLSAGTPDDLILTTGIGAPFVSHHHGNHWRRAPVDGDVTFAAFISGQHVVAITDGTQPAFVASDNGGRTWFETPFRHKLAAAPYAGSE